MKRSLERRGGKREGEHARKGEERKRTMGRKRRRGNTVAQSPSGRQKHHGKTRLKSIFNRRSTSHETSQLVS